MSTSCPGLVISLPSSPIPTSPPTPSSGPIASPHLIFSNRSTKQSHRTNTVAIATLPRSFFIPEILDILRSHFSLFGEINRWVSLPGFGRILVVYENEEHAEEAKRVCDPIVIQSEKEDENSSQVIRVYRADPNPLLPKLSPYGLPEVSVVPPTSYLQPPAVEKNFLISPPGSPPVGWEQIKEDPPNACPLAQDLMAALKKLEVQERRMGTVGSPTLEMLLHPEEAGVGVYVEDCDLGLSSEADLREEEWIYGETAPARTRWKIAPTMMPPINDHTIVV
ncbi:hypothetical protein AMATHDRAFT_137340 [Amanita thiersii Skay4041]|uniref:Calcipressin n=1 Tax=Amanita thiersii Skay4041 TaxID=703135 RepID=A0A2A9NRE8_9AGAR|nr:hypothetical protein AMATHDRAFT_137340 [Amanita thiersii Skay4041]